MRASEIASEELVLFFYPLEPNQLQHFVHLVLMDIMLGRWTWGHFIICFFLFTINNMLCITINVFYRNAPEGDRIPLSVAVIHRLAVCWFLNPPLSIAMLLNVSNLKFCRCQLLRKTFLQLLPNGSWRIKHLSNSMPCSCHIITPLINQMT